jgi:uncharacterized protein
MLFALICTDKPGSSSLRQSQRPAHLKFLAELGPGLKAAGAFTDDAGASTGSLVIVEAQTRAEAQKISAADPYAQAGLFAHVDIRPWNWSIKNPEA